MFGMGLGELLVVGVVLLLVVGPERLPRFMREAGRIYGQIRRASDELRHSFVMEADRATAEDRYRRAQERRKEVEEDRKKAVENTGTETVPQGSPVLAAAAATSHTIDGDPESPAPKPSEGDP